MTYITVWNDTNVLAFGEGFLPSLQQLQEACPRRPSYLYADMPWHFQIREEALAWTLSAIARREADRLRRGDLAARLAVDTWILGPPSTPDAPFQTWFEAKGPDYCVVLQRQALRDGAEQIPCCTGSAPHLPLRKKGIASKARTSAVENFLERLLDAYREGYPRVIEMLQHTNHPLVYSSGQPLRREGGRSLDQDGGSSRTTNRPLGYKSDADDCGASFL
ncbi:MAG: hypothetical protein FLDDKLPJ_03739 [Phycisphaerae bacterium]|nr:hypothetical protein [Phycisphaerae bacterium]